MIEKTFEDLIGGKGALKTRMDENYRRVRECWKSTRSKGGNAVQFTQGDYDTIYKTAAGAVAVLMTERDILFEAHKLNKERLSEQDTRIALLEHRLSQVEKKSMRYRGVYQKAEEYHRGDAVTAGGSLFICVIEKATAAPPSDAWQLAVKKGDAS